MSDTSSKSRRRYLQFSLRTLLILVTVIVGLLAAWRVVVEPFRRQREVMILIERLGGGYTTEAGGPAWMRKWFGEDRFQNITKVTFRNVRLTDADVRHLRGLNSLRSLDLSFTGISDSGLGHLNGLVNLRKLQLDGTPVGDAGMVHLEGMTKLKVLSICYTDVSDIGLAHLKGLNELQKLNVVYTRISDVGLARLKGMPDLRELQLDGTLVSDAGLVHLGGLSKLRHLRIHATHATKAGAMDLSLALPNCRIEVPLEFPNTAH